jgi:hypothetical protein
LEKKRKKETRKKNEKVKKKSIKSPGTSRRAKKNRKFTSLCLFCVCVCLRERKEKENENGIRGRDVRRAQKNERVDE